MSLRSHVAVILTVAATLLLPVLAARAQQTPLRVGIVFTYSGGGPPIGKELDAAIAAYVQQHGVSAGGRKIEFLRRDDTGVAPDIARREAQELIVRDHVDLLAGLMFTPNAIAVGDVSTQSRTPLFVTNAATSGILTKNPYMVRFSHTEQQTTAPLALWAARNGIKTVFSIYLDYGPGIEANAIFRSSFESAGGHVVGSTSVPLSTQDYAAYIQRIRDAKPDAVFAFVGAQNGGQPFLHAFAQSGLASSGVRLLATGDLVIENNLPALGDAAIGIISSSPYSATHDSALNRAFVKAYIAAGGPGLPDYSAVAAYDAVAAIYRIVQAQHGNVDPDKTMELLKDMKFESPRGPIKIDAGTRDIVQNVYIRRTVKRDDKLMNIEFATVPMVRDVTE